MNNNSRDCISASIRPIGHIYFLLVESEIFNILYFKMCFGLVLLIHTLQYGLFAVYHITKKLQKFPSHPKMQIHHKMMHSYHIRTTTHNSIQFNSQNKCRKRWIPKCGRRPTSLTLMDSIIQIWKTLIKCLLLNPWRSHFFVFILICKLIYNLFTSFAYMCSVWWAFYVLHHQRINIFFIWSFFYTLKIDFHFFSFYLILNFCGF